MPAGPTSAHPPPSVDCGASVLSKARSGRPRRWEIGENRTTRRPLATPQKLPPQMPMFWVIVTKALQTHQRQSQSRCQRAGPVDVGDRQPQHGDAGAPAAGAPAPSVRRRRRATARTPESRKRRHSGDTLVVSEPDRDRDQAMRLTTRHQGKVAPSRPMPHVPHRLPEQRRHRHVMHRPSATARSERGQQAVE